MYIFALDCSVKTIIFDQILSYQRREIKQLYPDAMHDDAKSANTTHKSKINPTGILLLHNFVSYLCKFIAQCLPFR